MVMDRCWISGGGCGEGGPTFLWSSSLFSTLGTRGFARVRREFSGSAFSHNIQKTLGELNHMLNEGLKSANSP